MNARCSRSTLTPPPRSTVRPSPSSSTRRKYQFTSAASIKHHALALARPDGHVAWVDDGTARGLQEALQRWFGPAAA
ncbi:hypothetical protein [Ralstonia sp. GX3-BWBA]|uniref:aromatic-ring hydroxylase C-terminal domain-containing protein n=1 Tax=Ralstonia sp. GX3-BWBA TaxID=2219865 RepID=UPI0031BA83A2